MARLSARAALEPSDRKAPFERCIGVLEVVAAANTPGLSLTALSQRCDLSVATTYRIIQTLLSAGLIIACTGRKKEYVVGPRLFQLLHAGTGDGWLKHAAQPVLDGLSKALGETCFVTQLVGKKIISVARSVPPDGLRSKVHPGDVMPPHAAASAKAILAYQVDALIPHILRMRERYTIQTKTELARIREEYMRIRRDGFATCWDELSVGHSAIACPIAIEGLNVQYAVAVTGFTERLKRRSTEETVALLKEGVSRLKSSIESGVSDSGEAVALQPRRSRHAPSARKPASRPQQRGHRETLKAMADL